HPRRSSLGLPASTGGGPHGHLPPGPRPPLHRLRSTMSAFRARPPKGPSALTGSEHRRAIREEGGKAGVRCRDLSLAHDEALARAEAFPEGSLARAVAEHRARRIAFGVE